MSAQQRLSPVSRFYHHPLAPDQHRSLGGEDILWSTRFIHAFDGLPHPLARSSILSALCENFYHFHQVILGQHAVRSIYEVHPRIICHPMLDIGPAELSEIEVIDRSASQTGRGGIDSRGIILGRQHRELRTGPSLPLPCQDPRTELNQCRCPAAVLAFWHAIDLFQIAGQLQICS